MAGDLKGAVDAALLEMQRSTTLAGGVLAFFASLPPETPIRDAIAALDGRNDEVEAMLTANVPPVTPA